MQITVELRQVTEQLKRIADTLEELAGRSGSGLRSRYADSKQQEDYGSMVYYEVEEKKSEP